MNPYPLVRVIWIDASGSDNDHGWQDLDDLLREPDRAYVCESVGWLVADGKNVKKIVSNMSVPDADIGAYPAYFNDIRLTTEQIVSIEELVPKPPKRKHRTIKPAAKQ